MKLADSVQMEIIEESKSTVSTPATTSTSTSTTPSTSTSRRSSGLEALTNDKSTFTDLNDNSGETPTPKKLSIKSIDENGEYKIEKESRIESSSSSGSCFSCCQGLNQAQLDALKAIAKRREKKEVCFSCCHGKTKSKYFRMSYYRNNLSFFITFIVYLLLQIGLGLLQYFLYIQSNWAVRIARVGGILINLNSGLVILLVLRRLTTWIRNSAIGRNYLPIDDSIKFHKFVGLFIFFLSLVHTTAHCVNLCKLFLKKLYFSFVYAYICIENIRKFSSFILYLYKNKKSIKLFIYIYLKISMFIIAIINKNLFLRLVEF